MATSRVSDEIVSEDQVVVSPRGRKAQTDPVLVDLFAKLQPGQAVVLRSAIGSVEKDKRSTTSGTIRKNFAAAHPGNRCRIDYTPDGIPQVRFHKATAEAE